MWICVKNDLLISTEKCSTEGSDFRVAAKTGNILYVGTSTAYVEKFNVNGEKLEKLGRFMLGNSEYCNRLRYDASSGGMFYCCENGLVRIAVNGKPECISSKYEELSGMKFRSVTELSDGRILIASNMGLTFLRDGRPELLLSDSDGLNNRYILSMIERDDGAVLAASDGDGIYIIKNDKVAGHIGAEEGLETAVILRIVPCKGGYLYVSSNGLYYDEGGKVRRLKNFPYSNNYDILISDSGSCYITSSAGLFIVSEEKLIEDKQYACTLLNESWGLNTTFTANSWNIMEGGYLCLCCTDGVRMISADNYGTDGGVYQMHLKSIEADGKALDQTDGKWVIPSKTRRIVLNISVNNFSLSNPRIHYYLDGSKDDGITCCQNEITPLAFTNLAYGKK